MKAVRKKSAWVNLLLSCRKALWMKSSSAAVSIYQSFYILNSFAFIPSFLQRRTLWTPHIWDKQLWLLYKFSESSRNCKAAGPHGFSPKVVRIRASSLWSWVWNRSLSLSLFSSQRFSSDRPIKINALQTLTLWLTGEFSCFCAASQQQRTTYCLKDRVKVKNNLLLLLLLWLGLSKNSLLDPGAVQMWPAYTDF